MVAVRDTPDVSASESGKEPRAASAPAFFRNARRELSDIVVLRISYFVLRICRWLSNLECPDLDVSVKHPIPMILQQDSALYVLAKLRYVLELAFSFVRQEFLAA